MKTFGPPASAERKISGISAFFPAYNDGGTIASMVVSTLMTLREVAEEYEVIVVNDGSADYTGELLDELARIHAPFLRVVHHPRNRGYGAALRSGFAAARKDWVFYTDGDAQYDPRELRLLVAACQERGGEVDVVNGYKISRHDPWYRLLIGRVYHHFVKGMFGFRLRDVDCDFRLIRRAVFDQISLRSDSGTICLELVKKLQDAGFRFAEVPVHHFTGRSGRSQFFNFRRLWRTGVHWLACARTGVERRPARAAGFARAAHAGSRVPRSGSRWLEGTAVIWYVAALVWILQILFWGIGLTLLSTPARWRRFWPAFCAPVGLALQSVVVWIGAHTPLPGTDSYAVAALAIPAGLLAAALYVQGVEPVGRLLAGAWRWWAVAVLMVASLTMQAYPFTRPPGQLTSVAIGSCDAADYAGGARVFKEFSSRDRSGFLGNTAIAESLSVDNFFDFWLRINHFSPSAIIALNSSLCGRQPYELTTLLGIVLLTLHLPGVFWLARSAFRFGPAGSLGVATIYGFSPIVYYAMYQTALGQLLAAMAVALLTWAGWQAYRGPKTWRRLAAWSGPLLVGDWLLFGGYNFFILFAYVPLLAYVGVQTLRRRDWNGTWRWSILIGANLLICAVVFPDRVMSIVERFKLFNQTAFGWSIPGFWPGGWYGAFGDTLLSPNPATWVGALAAVGLALAAVSVIRLTRPGRWHAGSLAACCTLPILFGYWFLLRADRMHHDHSSYDAFKLFSVFYPGILISLCLWLRGPHRTWAVRAGVVACWAGLLAVNVASAARFNLAVRKTPLVVDHDLAALSEIERLPEVRSVNITMTQVWDRLWANCFLLHKPQYFSVSAYEGRPATALLGQWDLSQRLVSARVGSEGDPLVLNATYSLVKRLDNRFVEARLDRGWYVVEHRRKETWCWGSERPTVRILNPQGNPLAASLNFSVRCLSERHLRLCAGEHLLWEGMIGITTREVEDVPLDLPPGTTWVRLESLEALTTGPGDPRSLTFLLNRFQVNVQNPPATLPGAEAAETASNPTHVSSQEPVGVH